MKQERKEKNNNNNNSKAKKIIIIMKQQKTNQVKFVWTDFSACLDFPLYPALVLSEAVWYAGFRTPWRYIFASQCQKLPTFGS